MYYILNHVHNTSGLPTGALQHLLSVPEAAQSELKSVLSDFKEVFPEELPFSLPPDRGIDDVHRIQVKPNTKPISKAPYKTGPHESAIIKKEVDELLASGMIQPSNSPWASPVLLVKKPDGSIRFCTDFRGLNSVTIRDRYPIPRTQELVDRLGNARYFSSLDLRSGYWQIRLHESDTPKSAFITRFGQYEWRVLTFGFCNAPSTFQRVMNKIFASLLDKCVVVYLDDILIYSRTLAEHKKHLRQVL